MYRLNTTFLVSMLAALLLISCEIDLTDDKPSDNPTDNTGTVTTLSGSYIWVKQVHNDTVAQVGDDNGEILSFSGDSYKIYDYGDSAIDSSNAGTFSLSEGYLYLGSKQFPIYAKGDSVVITVTTSDGAFQNYFVPYFGTIPPASWVTATPKLIEGLFILVKMNDNDTVTTIAEIDAMILRLDGGNYTAYQYNNGTIDSSDTGQYENDSSTITIDSEGHSYEMRNDTLDITIDGSDYLFIPYSGPIPPKSWLETTTPTLAGTWEFKYENEGLFGDGKLLFGDNGSFASSITYTAYYYADQDTTFTGEDLKLLLETAGIPNPEEHTGSWKSSNDSLIITMEGTTNTYTYRISNDTLWVQDDLGVTDTLTLSVL